MERTELENNESEPRVAIVTGAAKRIGAGITRTLHQSGYNMLVHYRSDKSVATDLINELNDIRADSAIGVHADLVSDSAPDELVSAAVDHWGRLDLLVNCASQFFPTPVGSISAEVIQSIFASNVQAPLLLAQAALPHLQSTDGCVVNIVDIYSGVVHKEHPVYCASKAALAMLTKSLAVEFAPRVRVNGISPGAILWPDGDAEISEQKKSEILGIIPLARMGHPDQIAGAVKYLSSTDAGFITGQILALDGGRTL